MRSHSDESGSGEAEMDSSPVRVGPVPSEPKDDGQPHCPALQGTQCPGNYETMSAGKIHISMD